MRSPWNSTPPRHASIQRATRRPRGFSLIEFTAVLTLMAILAGIITLNVRHFMTKGKQNAARAQIATLRDALEAYYNASGRYPTDAEGLTALTQKTEAAPEPLIRHVPVDPWGHAYQYNQPGRNGEPFEVICFGADGREGGAGGDADISSSDLRVGAAEAK